MVVVNVVDLVSANISSSAATATSSTSAAGSTSSSTSNANGTTTASFTKNVLEWLFLTLAALVMTSMILRRFKTLRQNGQPVTTFFSNRDNGLHLRSIPRTRFPSASFGTLSAYDLTHVPAAYNPHASIAGYSSANRSHRTPRTRAADIGEGGRRLGLGLSDYNADMGEKDVLPAYDKHGGPPGYIDTLPVLLLADSRESGSGSEQTRGPAPNYSPVSEAHSDSHDYDNDSPRVGPA